MSAINMKLKPQMEDIITALNTRGRPSLSVKNLVIDGSHIISRKNAEQMTQRLDIDVGHIPLRIEFLQRLMWDLIGKWQSDNMVYIKPGPVVFASTAFNPCFGDHIPVWGRLSVHHFGDHRFADSTSRFCHHFMFR
ncbi:unnamed protein product [Medioppia subpectinata]|uniref:Uncharacterized protein n=1 Tax=Medioppia subpectinata TaxID=1979941 RepID=A0A7R9QAP6_9ACAR|nr:unnamed protein product [Medioppia subpectinata]CAG2116920.1 unnamed protein product [Medioppia subpectinata]